MTIKYTRGPNWKRQRKAARLRDNNTCQHCGTTEGRMTVNHIWPFRLFDDYREANQLSNLMTLCPSCHSKADIAFSKAHSDIFPTTAFPQCLPLRNCDRCAMEYQPGSGASKLCDACHTFVCAYCGGTFKSTRAALRPVKYCSKPCRNADCLRNGWKGRIKQCLNCGIAFTRKQSSTRYCSQACHVKHDPPDQHRLRVVEARMRAVQASGQTATAT